MKVEPQDIRAVLRGFLELLESTDKQATIELLELWLGQLAFVQHFITPFVVEYDLALAPLDKYNDWQKIIAEKFPRLVINEPSNPAGSALEDLTKIAEEIAESLHRWDVAGDFAGLWYFQYSYQLHWSAHLHSLQAYLSSVQVSEN